MNAVSPQPRVNRTDPPRRSSLRRLIAVGAFGSLLLPLPSLLPSVISTNLLLVSEGQTLSEDAYVATNSAVVAGVIDGDLIIATTNLSISGTVKGDVLVAASGTVTIGATGLVEGSIRGAARSVVVDGTVRDDVAVLALGTTVNGLVERDVLLIGGSVTVDGRVGRDVRGRFVSGTVKGEVGRDVDAIVSTLDIGSTATVAGDVLYRSSRDARAEPGSTIGGQFLRLPSGSSFFVGVVLTVANIVGFLAFLLLGIVVFWLFRSTGPRATAAIATRPWRSLGVGLATIVLLPIVGVLFAATLVGIPVAFAVVMLLVFALIAGPIPAVTAFGNRILRTRGGVFGAFLLGAVVWRGAIWLIPFVGFALYLAALAWGVGGWTVGAWEERRIGARSAPALLPSPVSTGGGSVVGVWEPPLPPEPASEAPLDGPEGTAGPDSP